MDVSHKNPFGLYYTTLQREIAYIFITLQKFPCPALARRFPGLWLKMVSARPMFDSFVVDPVKPDLGQSSRLVI